MHIILIFFISLFDEYCTGENRSAISTEKVVDLHNACMGIQCITAERLNVCRTVEPQMEALRELEEFVEKLDLTPQEEQDVARIMERLREEKR